MNCNKSFKLGNNIFFQFINILPIFLLIDSSSTVKFSNKYLTIEI